MWFFLGWVWIYAEKFGRTHGLWVCEWICVCVSHFQADCLWNYTEIAPESHRNSGDSIPSLENKSTEAPFGRSRRHSIEVRKNVRVCMWVCMRVTKANETCCGTIIIEILVRVWIKWDGSNRIASQNNFLLLRYLCLHVFAERERDFFRWTNNIRANYSNMLICQCPTTSWKWLSRNDWIQCDFHFTFNDNGNNTETRLTLCFFFFFFEIYCCCYYYDFIFFSFSL